MRNKLSFFNGIDWALLRKQQETLLGLQNLAGDYCMASDEAILLPEESNTLGGIINLIDALQDEAVELGFSEETVFGSKIEEENDGN